MPSPACPPALACLPARPPARLPAGPPACLPHREFLTRRGEIELMNPALTPATYKAQTTLLPSPARRPTLRAPERPLPSMPPPAHPADMQN